MLVESNQEITESNPVGNGESNQVRNNESSPVRNGGQHGTEYANDSASVLCLTEQ